MVFSVRFIPGIRLTCMDQVILDPFSELDKAPVTIQRIWRSQRSQKRDLVKEEDLPPAKNLISLPVVSAMVSEEP